MKQYIRISLLGLVALTLFFVGCDNSDDAHYADANWDNADLVRGGLLYDKWWSVNGGDSPSADFDPLWASQSNNTRSGGDTWRCKECHGWDYIGKDGRYSSGSHYTGFDGVMDASSNSHAAIFDAIKDAGGDHDLSDRLSDADVLDLVKFISEGLIDMYAYMDPDTYAGTGDATNGATLFSDNCAFCHGADGTEIDFKDDPGEQGVGWLANDNPQEVFHKIRWGHPGSLGTAEEMPSMVGLGLTDAETGDILTFTQTLPQ
ncbi:MAG: c-type cytochrome [Fidelibacterota bacterium]